MSVPPSPGRRPGAILIAIAAPVVALGLAVGLSLPGGGSVSASEATAPIVSASADLPVTASTPTTAAPVDASASGSEVSPSVDSSRPSVSESAIDASADSMSMAPEGAASRPASADAESGVQTLVNVTTDDPVIFITIDDGMHQDPEALALVKQRSIPITAFLTEWTTHDNPEWFNEITAYGGSIQNHSMTHKNLDDPKTNLHHEICATQSIYEERFGTEPWMLRPPYGAGYDNDKVQQMAAECGISRIIMWNVTVAEGGKSVEYWDAPLRPGDIVLTHFDEDLHLSLQKILELAAEQGLTPAPLEDYI